MIGGGPPPNRPAPNIWRMPRAKQSMKIFQIDDGRAKIRKIDGRTRSVYPYFTHRVECYESQFTTEFMDWATEAFGPPMLYEAWRRWNSFTNTSPRPQRDWLVRSYPSTRYTEFYLNDETLPGVILRWKD